MTDKTLEERLCSLPHGWNDIKPNMTSWLGKRSLTDVIEDLVNGSHELLRTCVNVLNVSEGKLRYQKHLEIDQIETRGEIQTARILSIQDELVSIYVRECFHRITSQKIHLGRT